MADEPKLLPCPFCGSSALFKFKSGDWGYTSPTVRVSCSACWAKTPEEATEAWAEGLGHYTVEFSAKVEVAEMWNAREADRA